MTYVYILSDYEEHGAENVVATLERTRLPDLVTKNWPEPTEISSDAPKPYWRQEKHKEWMANALAGLEKLLARSDEELSASQHGWNCHQGWGGMQLHVVRLK